MVLQSCELWNSVIPTKRLLTLHCLSLLTLCSSQVNEVRLFCRKMTQPWPSHECFSVLKCLKCLITFYSYSVLFYFLGFPEICLIVPFYDLIECQSCCFLISLYMSIVMWETLRGMGEPGAFPCSLLCQVDNSFDPWTLTISTDDPSCLGHIKLYFVKKMKNKMKGNIKRQTGKIKYLDLCFQNTQLLKT